MIGPRTRAASTIAAGTVPVSSAGGRLCSLHPTDLTHTSLRAVIRVRRCRRLRLDKDTQIVPRKMTLILDLDETLVHSRSDFSSGRAPVLGRKKYLSSRYLQRFHLDSRIWTNIHPHIHVRIPAV